MTDKNVHFSEVSLEKLEEILQRQTGPIAKSVIEIEQALFRGTDKTTAIVVELAIHRERLEYIHAYVEKLAQKKGGSIPPPPSNRRLPDHFWKATGTILIAIATAITSVFVGQKQSAAPQPEPPQTLSAQRQVAP